MGHSFTTYRNKHIRSKDYKIETWLFFICREIDDMKNKPDWLLVARNAWLEEARISVNGCMDPRLDEYLDTNEKLELFKEICQKIMVKLAGFGEMIPKEYLNELCEKKPPCHIMEDNETELYFGYGKALLTLLAGKQSEECVSA